MFRVDTRAWSKLADILGLGNQALAGIGQEVSPVQDLSRILMADKVKTTMYFETDVAAATKSITKQWNDASDWDEVFVDGVLTSADGDLPQPGDDRFVVMASIHLAGTVANYTSAELFRITVAATSTFILMGEWGAFQTSHNAPTMVPPMLLPQKLGPLETDARLHEVVSGVDCAFNWSIQMISAEPGVLSAFPGL